MGSIYNIIDYPRLANHIEGEFGSKNFFGGDGVTTFAVPDLRGEFLRGTGTNGATEISGRNVGYHQDGTTSGLTYVYAHNISSGSIGGYVDSVTSSSILDKSNGPRDKDSVVSDNSIYRVYTGNISIMSVEKNDTDFTRYTSRPTNTSVLYCIRW